MSCSKVRLGAGTTGEPTLPGLSAFLNSWTVGWPWRFLKTNVKDYKMSELFRNLHQALPSDMPVLTSHMWTCMGAVAGGMTNVVDMMFDNWPMAFQLTEGAKHGVQSPSGYYGFRAMRGFDERGAILNPTPPDAIYYTGHHVDHGLVENIEVDCAARLARMRNGEPWRFLVTMGGAGASASCSRRSSSTASRWSRPARSRCSSTWATTRTTGPGCRASWPATRISSRRTSPGRIPGR